MRSLSVFVAACALTLVQLQPASAVTSTFNAGIEGWTLGDADNPTVSPTSNGALSWNPAGYITGTEHQGGPINAFFAPSTYVGNQLGAYGGTFSFDLLAELPTDNVAYSAAYLFGNGRVISNVGLLSQGSTFTSFSFGLTESAGWRTYSSGGNYGGSTLSQADFQAVMANLTFVGILIDWKTGEDIIRLDNVFFGSAVAAQVPIPGVGLPGLLLACAGLLGRWRRKPGNSRCAPASG